jgi:prepilin-type N-terminal cleavage/methylation domain-containing protein
MKRSDMASARCVSGPGGPASRNGRALNASWPSVAGREPVQPGQRGNGVVCGRLLAARNEGTRPGFTLVEMLVALVAGGVICLAASIVLLEGSAAASNASRRSSLCDAAARAMEQMLRYVREIEQDAGLTGIAQITTADAGDLRFGPWGFRRNGSVVEMTGDGGGVWRRACTDVSSLTFGYFDANGAALSPTPLSAAQRGAVRQVSIDLTLTGGGQSVRLRTAVYLRKFMNEAAI